MHQVLTRALRQRDQPIRVALAGAGWLGSGLARQMAQTPGLEVAVLVDRDLDRARTVREQVRGLGAGTELLVSDDLDSIGEVDSLDLVFEATGDLRAGVRLAKLAFDRGVHFVTGACELDACLGLALARRAQERGVVYSNADGDQPVCLSRMLDEITHWGFEPKVVGNCKGFLDVQQNPDGVVPFVPDHQDLYKVVAMADGSKQSEEMACLGNVIGCYPTRRGMHGPTVTKGTLVETFDRLLNLETLEGTQLDFVEGIRGVDQGAGVFVVARRDDALTRADMKFLKKGDGPNYLFFRDHHLCFYECLSTIVQAVCFEAPAFCARGRFVDVMTVAKADIAAGQPLGRVGGFLYYGVVERADVVAEEGFLPYGIAELATAREDIPAGAPVYRNAVQLAPSPVLEMRLELEALPLG